MNCVACGHEISTRKCSKCGLDYSEKTIFFISQLSDLEIEEINNIVYKPLLSKSFQTTLTHMSYDIDEIMRKKKNNETEAFITRNDRDFQQRYECLNKVVSTKNFSSGTSKPMSYDQYMLKLVNMCKNSKITDFEIEEFINKNQLNRRYGITSNDVKTDINMILSKIKTKRNETKTDRKKNKVFKRLYECLNQVVSTKKVTLETVTCISYDQYMLELKKMCKHSKPTDLEIEEFIKKNRLDRHYGITISDVKSDISTINAEQQDDDSSFYKLLNDMISKKGD